jgi:hypothetical protein
LACGEFADVVAGGDQRGACRGGRGLDLAGLVQVVQAQEGLRGCLSYGEQAVVAEDHRGVAAQVGDQAALFGEVEGDAFVVVVAEPAVELRGDLVEQKQAVFLGGDRAALCLPETLSMQVRVYLGGRVLARLVVAPA